MKNGKLTIILAVAVVAAMTVPAGAEDFTLTGSQEKDVTTRYSKGRLYDYSLARILAGGIVGDVYSYNSSIVNVSGGTVGLLGANDDSTVNISGGWLQGNISSSASHTSTVNISGGTIVNSFNAYDTSKVNISGGWLNSYLDARDNSTVNMSDGSVDSLGVRDISTVNISGGSVYSSLGASQNSSLNISGGHVDWLRAYDTSTVNITGGNVNELYVDEASKVIFSAEEFILSDGLTWDVDGQTILGTGLLSGRWFGSSDIWTVDIYSHDATATITAIPEPCSVLLLGLGGLALRYRKSKR